MLYTSKYAKDKNLCPTHTNTESSQEVSFKFSLCWWIICYFRHPHNRAIHWLTTILFRPATKYLACIEEHHRQATHTKTDYHIFK